MQNGFGHGERLARIVPVFEFGFDKPTPERRVTIIVERAAADVVMRLTIALHHVVGRGSHRLQPHVALHRRIGRLHDVDQAHRFRPELIAEIETRECQACVIGVFGTLRRDMRTQPLLRLVEARALRVCPIRQIEEGRAVVAAQKRLRRLRHGDGTFGHCKARWVRCDASTCTRGHDDIEIIGIGPDDKTGRCRQHREFRVAPRVEHAASEHARHDDKRIAGGGIGLDQRVRPSLPGMSVRQRRAWGSACRRARSRWKRAVRSVAARCRHADWSRRRAR